jgi:hypothetical protein
VGTVASHDVGQRRAIPRHLGLAAPSNTDEATDRAVAVEDTGVR